MTVRTFIKSSYTKILTTSCVLLLLTACGSEDGAAVLVNGVKWTAPSTRADGAALALSEIAGYRVYLGATVDDYTDVVEVNDPTAQQAELGDAVAAGTYFVVVTTVDVDGRESEFSLPAVRVQI